MAEPESAAVVVEAAWGPAQTRTLKNKLQLYFQSRKKSNGGDCRVEAEEGARTAKVYFASPEVRARVLAKTDHEISVDGAAIRLRLSPAAVSPQSPATQNLSASTSNLTKCPTERSDSNAGDGAAAAAATKGEAEPGDGAAAAAATKGDSEPVHSDSVVLENMKQDTSRDLLSMIVQNVLGSDDIDFSVEIIWESSKAVVTSRKPIDVEQFLAASRTNRNMRKHELTARRLEAATGVRVENPPAADVLEVYFEKFGASPDKIVTIPDEQAALVTFSDPEVVRRICLKRDHKIGSVLAKLYPHYESLGSALYGEERPSWKMPKPFTEHVDHAVWKYLLMKKDLQSINDQMRPCFCRVELGEDKPEATLSPVPSLLRQKDLTAEHVDAWMSTVREAFHQQMSQYSVFECPAYTSAWKAAAKNVSSVVKEDAVLVPDASKGTLTVAGRTDDIKRVRAPVEAILLKAMNQIERETNGVSEDMDLSPAMFFILEQEGLQKATQDISPDMNISYDDSTQKLTIAGLVSEVFQCKSWILEKTVRLRKRPLNADPCLLDFLKMVNPEKVSQDLFTSQGICAFYTLEKNKVFLTGSSDSSLADAEGKLATVLSVQTLDVEDQDVLDLYSWNELRKQLLDTYNSSRRKTVAIQVHPERRAKITVAGFMNPVKEVSRSLKEFIVDHSQVQETIRVKSCAVVQFINKRKMNDWNSIITAHKVNARFESEKKKITISGARVDVHKARSCFQELISSLFTDTFTVDKPGAKKYFMSQGSLFLSTIMTEFSCVVMLRPKNQEEDEEEEDFDVVNGQCLCKVQTIGGVLVCVSKADMCSFIADAVVNAANEDLQHIGGLALALREAAGPQLQKASDDYVAQNGRLRPGEATVTEAGRLPCKYVVHTVGPRFSDSSRKQAVSCLKLAVKESLRQAEGVQCSSIALPAISSGVFGFPTDLCAETIAEAVREYCDSPRGVHSLAEIHLVDNNHNTVRALASAVQKEFSDLGPVLTEPPRAGGRGDEASGGRERGRGQSPSARGRGRGAGRKENAFKGGHQDNREDQRPRGPTRPEGAGGSGRMEQTTAEGLKIVLCKGNIQDQTTDVIVNTIGVELNLNQGAVSQALLSAAGPGLQAAVRAQATGLKSRDVVVVTDGFGLSCQKVFHAVCPFWDHGKGRSEEGLIKIIRVCLEQAEKLQMASLSFPAIGTGMLSFPRDLVSRVLLSEIQSYSCKKAPRHLREVSVVVHPGDSLTVECFTREFKGQSGERNVQRAGRETNELPVSPSPRKSQQAAASASISQVSSSSLGWYQMQIGPVSLEVSSGDITKETSDAIVNSSNKDFNLKSGVSRAILEAAGQAVELDCDRIVNSPGYRPGPMILTSAGKLSSKAIVHVAGQSDPDAIKDVVQSVLNVCEENRFNSVAFPALGTGQGGARPSAVADAMVGAVVDFVRKKQPKFVQSVKVLIFQTAMIPVFHQSMKSRQGEGVEEKTLLTKIKGFFSFGRGAEQPAAADPVVEEEEFEPAVFDLCADNQQDVGQAKRKITDLIVAEQATKTIADPYIRLLSRDDLEQLKRLQRELTITIRVEKEVTDQEPSIQLEGLTRDVFTADSMIRDIIRKVERVENRKNQALVVGNMVQWFHEDGSGTMVPFDKDTNLNLEEALEKTQPVEVYIRNRRYSADARLRKAVPQLGHADVKLLRKDLKEAAAAALPPHWDNMNGDPVKLFPVAPGSKEYGDVEAQFRRTGLSANIIKVERVQNETLWQSYQLLKKEMEKKNKHKRNEKLLFHGTSSASIDLINKQGFNRGYAGAHGAMLGNGSYFAVDPCYSAQGYARADAQGHKPMYLARVLVGDFVLGHRGLITPPPRGSGSTSDLYDSVTDNPAAPSMFVVFNDIQAYPEYLITFT